MTNVTVTGPLRFRIDLYGATETGSVLGGMKTPAAATYTKSSRVMWEMTTQGTTK